MDSTEKKLKKHETVCNDHNYYVEMLNEEKKILKHNHGEKSLKAPFMIYADLECLLEIIHSCQNNLEKSYTEKQTKHMPSAIHCLQIVHLIQQKTNLIVREVKMCGKVL